VIVKIIVLDVPPPGAWLNTFTTWIPVFTMSVDASSAVRREEDTKDVARFKSPHLTTEVFVKPLPSTVRVNDGLPCAALLGFVTVISGDGFVTGGIANTSALSVITGSEAD
jgi:hypothetical protein